MPNGQNGEDAILLAHFGEKTDGRFLDVGGWGVPTFSNTYAFAQRGWSGVVVEPSPKPFLGLLEAYDGFPDIHLVNVAVSDRCGLADWHDEKNGDAVSTLSKAHRELWEQGSRSTFRTFTVNTTTVPRLIDRFGTEFDLLSVDVEGGSAALLKEFPIGGMPRLRAIVVEHDGRADELAAWARQWGFSEPDGTRSGENLILLR